MMPTAPEPAVSPLAIVSAPVVRTTDIAVSSTLERASLTVCRLSTCEATFQRQFFRFDPAPVSDRYRLGEVACVTDISVAALSVPAIVTTPPVSLIEESPRTADVVLVHFGTVFVVPLPLTSPPVTTVMEAPPPDEPPPVTA